MDVLSDERAKDSKYLRNTLSTFEFVNKAGIRPNENVTAPSNMDWRTKGTVTGIKNQGQCGCCWGLSTVSCYRRNQQSLYQSKNWWIVTRSSDMGCEGGLMGDAFEFIINNYGLTTESNYPYEGTDSTCKTSKKSDHAAKITGNEDVPTNSESSLLKPVANQPVSVAIDPSDSHFQFYSSGVFNGECGTELDHGVTAVGYGEDSDGSKYWLVKNSWGMSWCEKGYIRMQRDVDAEEGLCGIAK